MKKNLLSFVAILISTMSFGQSAKSVLTKTRMQATPQRTVNESVTNPNPQQSTHQTSQARHGSGNGNHTSTVCNVIPLGSAPNAFGAASGSRTQVSYDQNLNTVAFIHRAKCGTPPAVKNTGYYTYDISTDGGSTWANDQGPIYGTVLNNSSSCTVLGPHRARYPKGTMYNPSGNTNPSSAHLTYTGPWNTDLGATTNWYGQVHGTGHFDGSAANENYDSLLSGMAFSPDDIFVTKQGVSWMVGTVTAQDATPTYRDSIAIYKGVWNGSDFIYTPHHIPYRINPDAVFIPDMNIAFGDDGQTGYIALLTNQDSTYSIYPDSTYYIQVLKTTDGGQTWSCPQDLIVAGALDSSMLVINGQTRYNLWTDMDMVVDKNNNLHIIAEVIPQNGAAFNNFFQGYVDRTYGLVDFYTTDQAATWKAQVIAHPETFFGSFGTVNVDEIQQWLNPFASRTWDGSKIYFGWFDTDTLTFGIFTNTNPDLHLIGYDVDANTWTRDLSNLQAVDAGENITTLSNADGACTFGNGSYYAKEGGPTPTVPVVYQVVGNAGVDVSLPCSFFYVDCAAPSGTFTFSGHPLNIPTAFNSPLCADGSGIVLGVVNNNTAELGVSSNYPNPFSGKTSVDVTLAKAGDVTVEISNIVGQRLVSTNYKNLHTGVNTLTIDGSSLAHGMYFYTVKAGLNTVTRTMTVE
jgi:hypothetical protein